MIAELLDSIWVRLIALAIAISFAYICSVYNKLNNLNPSAKRCYHIDKLPSIYSFIPHFLVFAIIKPRGKTLPYCQLIPPFEKEKKKKNQKRPIQTINTLNPNQSEHANAHSIEVYEYFSEIQVMIDSISINPLHLVAYNKLFQKNDFDKVSICYLNAMRLPLTAYIMSKNEFPVSPYGLIHIGTEISMHCELKIEDEYEITTSLNEIRQTLNGIELDILTVAYMNNGTNLVYECVETLLSTKKHKTEQSVEWKEEFDVNKDENKQNDIVKKEVDISSDIGTKYAQIVCGGDHLNKISAKLYGCTRQSVHKMWSLQKCLTEIKQMYADKALFIHKYPIKVVSSFKCPLFMPNKAKIITNCYNAQNYLTFALVSIDERKAHVLGSIVPDL